MAANLAIRHFDSAASPVSEDDRSRSVSTATTHAIEDVLVGIAIAVCALDKRIPLDVTFSVARTLLEAQSAGRASELLESSRAEAASLPDWHCAACGEGNPATFDLCWNCATPSESPITRLSPEAEAALAIESAATFETEADT